MDSKFYVSYEAARLLEEKGYDGECTNYYDESGELLFPYHHQECHVLYPVITKAEAIDWLERKGVIIEVLQDYRGVWFYVIKISETESYVSESDDNYFPTRLEAEEAAIIKALEML